MHPDNANLIVPNDGTVPVPDTVRVDPRAGFAAAVGDAINSIFQVGTQPTPPGNPPITNRPDAPAGPLPKSAKWEPRYDLERRALTDPYEARKLRVLHYRVEHAKADEVVKLALAYLDMNEEATVTQMRAALLTALMSDVKGSLAIHAFLPHVELNELDLQAARNVLWRVADALANGGPTNAHAINQAWEHLMPWLRVNPEQ